MNTENYWPEGIAQPVGPIDGIYGPKTILSMQILLLEREIAVLEADWLDTPAWRISKRKRLLNDIERLQRQAEQKFERLNALD